MLLFKIDKTYFFKGLSQVVKALPSKTQLPALQYVKLEVRQPAIYLTATDTDFTIQSVLPIAANENQMFVVNQEYDFLLPGKQLTELMKRVTGETVEFHLKEDSAEASTSILIKCGRSKFSLNTLDVQMFPNVLRDLTTATAQLSITSHEFKALINQTLPFASKLDQRPVLTGVHLETEGRDWTATATDSFRLARLKMESPYENEKVTLTIPAKPLEEMAKLLPNREEGLSLVIHNNQLIVTNGTLTFCTRLLDGLYPDTDNFIPVTFNNILTVNRLDLLKLLDRLMLIDPYQQTISLTLDTESSQMTFKAKSDTGHAEDELTASSKTRSPLVIGFNGDFLKTALHTLSSELIELKFNGDLRPFIIQSPGEENSLRLIVPVRFD